MVNAYSMTPGLQRWVPLVEHTHVHMHTHMLKSCLFYAGGNQKWLSRLAHPSMISIQCS